MPWIALVGPEFEENLSLRYLASSLEANGFRAEILAYHREGDLPRIVESVACADEPPLAVGLSIAFQWRAKDFLALALALRAAGYRGHITAGGHFATFASQELLGDFPELDSICRQECEETLVTLARALSSGAPLSAIPGLALRGEGGAPYLTEMPSLPDLAKLPWPDRRGAPAACFGHAISPLVASRGCYANCTFCCIAAWHEESQPGKRYRLRDVEDVAAEMVAMQRERNVEIFVFHDDNFFVPGHKKNAARFSALADALERRGIGRFATVVKARPTDVEREVFTILRDRLQCIRIYIGIETDADRGLITLGRWAQSFQNHRSIALMRELDLYTCFNMLIFDPDTEVRDLERNVAFLRHAPEFPFNFGRVELYAGTPLLGRMQLEKRCFGDYLQWDYALASPEVERIFHLAMECFRVRNFGEPAITNRLMATRFDVEVARHFHRDAFRAEWLTEGKRLSTRLAHDSADGLERILRHVHTVPADASADARLVEEMAPGLREVEREVGEGAKQLAADLLGAVGQGRPLTDVGDRVATPLQQARSEDYRYPIHQGGAT